MAPIPTQVILNAVIPVYLLVILGFFLRRREIVSASTESALFKLLIHLWVPCLVISVVARNPAFDNPQNILWPPIAGFCCVGLGVAISWIAGKLIFRNLELRSLRAFAYTTGVFNYGYIPIPLITILFGKETLGVLFVFNVGVEIGLWLFGMPMMAGSASPRQILRKILNPPLLTLAFSVLIRILNWGDHIPDPLWNMIETLKGCAIPIGIMLVGMAMADHISGVAEMRRPGPWILSCLLRNGALAALFLWVAMSFAWTREMTIILAIQGAMPAAVFPVVLAKHYGGDAKTATQIIFATSSLAFFTTPLWLKWAFKTLQIQ